MFAIKDFKCGEFLLEYAGNLVSKVEGEKLMLVPSCFFIMTIGKKIKFISKLYVNNNLSNKIYFFYLALMLLIILSLGNMLMTVK